MVFLNLEYECKIIKFRYKISVRKDKKCLAFVFFLDNFKNSSCTPVLMRLVLSRFDYVWLGHNYPVSDVYYLSFVLPGENRNKAFRSNTSVLLLFCPFQNTKSSNFIQCYVIFAIYTQSSKELKDCSHTPCCQLLLNVIGTNGGLFGDLNKCADTVICTRICSLRSEYYDFHLKHHRVLWRLMNNKQRWKDKCWPFSITECR
jgi:hypothetical protein